MRTWLRNLPTAHHRMMMRYLRKRGWVVFYLEEQHRTRCGRSGCWFNLYLEAEAHERSAR